LWQENVATRQASCPKRATCPKARCVARKQISVAFDPSQASCDRPLVAVTQLCLWHLAEDTPMAHKALAWACDPNRSPPAGAFQQLRLGAADACGRASPVGPRKETTMKQVILVLLGAVVAASLLLPVVTEAGNNLNQNDTLVRDAD
jgi:hypothetical protein